MYCSDKNPITQRIYKICEEKKISQSELARRINKRQSLISSWGQNETEPPAKLLIPIAHALDVSIEWLVTGENSARDSPELPQDEIRLLNYYHVANDEGKNRILEQAEFLSAKHPSNLESSGSESA